MLSPDKSDYRHVGASVRESRFSDVSHGRSSSCSLLLLVEEVLDNAVKSNTSTFLRRRRRKRDANSRVAIEARFGNPLGGSKYLLQVDLKSTKSLVSHIW